MDTGRPSPYDKDEHPRIAREQTAQGKTLADLAQLIGVARSTIQMWQENHPEFSVAIKLGREDATDRVERALFERAVGYNHKEEKLLVVSGGQGAGSTVERHETIAHYPPDTKAAQLWLNNLRPDRWKDKQHVEHTGKVTLESLLGESRKPDGQS